MHWVGNSARPRALRTSPQRGQRRIVASHRSPEARRLTVAFQDADADPSRFGVPLVAAVVHRISVGEPRASRPDAAL